VAAVDFALIQLEESPVSESANTAATPYRIATEKLYIPIRSARLGPGPSHLDRADELRSILGAVPKLIETFAPDGALSERCYPHDLTWLLALAGFTWAFTAGGALVTDPNSTTATGVNALNSATVNVADTSQFPAAGTFIYAGAATTYTGKTATSFTGCSNHAATVGGEVINGNVPTGASKWVFTKRAGINAQTAQIILNYADESVNLKGNGYGVSQLSLNADGELAADLMGLVMKRLAVDTTSVPVYASAVIPPVRRGDLYVSWLASGGAISDFSFQIANGLERVRSLSILPTSNYPDLMEYGDDQVKVTGSIPKRILAAADLDALFAATTFAAKARWMTPKVIGATAYPYSMWLEMPAAQLTAGSADELGNKRRHGGTYDFEAAYDETAGYDVKLTLVNDVTAIGASVGLPF
jgi:hypothetical protein